LANGKAACNSRLLIKTASPAEASKPLQIHLRFIPQPGQYGTGGIRSTRLYLPLPIFHPWLMSSDNQAGQIETRVFAERENEHLRVTVQDPNKPWRLILRGTKTIQTVANGTWQKVQQGIVIQPNSGVHELDIVL
jgi:hypothetical protein